MYQLFGNVDLFEFIIVDVHEILLSSKKHRVLQRLDQNRIDKYLQHFLCRTYTQRR